jgi:hypothetical protein
VHTGEEGGSETRDSGSGSEPAMECGPSWEFILNSATARKASCCRRSQCPGGQLSSQCLDTRPIRSQEKSRDRTIHLKGPAVPSI